MVHLDYRDARPIYTQIVDGLRGQIRAGILQQGDKLPSVRELASQLAINPNTIQRAYRELEMSGYVATVPGKGCFVCVMGSNTDTQQTDAWAALDKAAAQLMALGISRQEIAKHFGGENDA